jgi:hypothetical protein
MRDSFLGVDFSPVELAHRARLTEFLSRHPQTLSGYTFSPLLAWSEIFEYRWALTDETLFVSCVIDSDPNRHLLQPVGPLSPACTERFVRGAAALPYALRMIAVTDEFLAENKELVSHFDVVEDRTMANYVYRTKDLAELKGTHYSKKRNLIAQAANLYKWTVEPLEAKHVPACLDILEEYEDGERAALAAAAAEEMAASGGARKGSGRTQLALPQTMREEVVALKFTLAHFGALEQKGVLLSVEGKPAAFSIHEPLGPDTAVVHFERALRAYKGLYQLVNKAVAQDIAARGFAFINREEDLGDAGLRQAKESYHPSHLARAWALTFRG